MRSDKNAIVIRAIEVTDAEIAAQLSGELGYPVEAGQMRQRISQLNSLRNGVVYVACVADAVIGWIDVGIVCHLATGPFAEIGGFIISSQHRGGGIGRRLLAAAENWVAAQGFSNVLVRSRVTREAAHRFYLREGYLITKTSAVFVKELKR